MNLDESWDTIDIYGVETFDNDDEVTEERYVIMANGTTFIIKSEDYSKVSSKFEIVDTLSAPSNDFVDLGLPSGLKWANRNIGANAPEEFGLYFSWGNVEGHAEGSGYDFSSANYDVSPGKQISGDIALSQDAANAYLGGSCRMPTKTEFQELYDNCNVVWTTENGVNGRRFTSKTNGNSIFFPAAGYYNSTSLYNNDSTGYYWSASRYSDSHGCNLYFVSGNVYPQYNNYRRYGFPVRAVQ